ncbi:hypothetical protein [Hafnia psychrotolerans]|uniref:Uncharacterized protein n=1 Tax=Hafnia psychrotolerans TaxID=1477018 RepID=A0ABQ1H861_9GAMM|nr:hypothetical protein [Hafnia psychrotolerans]GGA61895.1 hypothetical protein GCM10011328_41480 [Hafnia psychrotolerans]
MSAKTHFLKKLQALQSSCPTFDSKTEADIAAFRQRLTQLHTRMDAWLKETGICIEGTSVSLIDLLVGQRAFEVLGIILCYENRTITFTPLFLYGQGVTGCVEVNLCAEGSMTPICRLFMRAGRRTEWCCTRASLLSGPVHEFDEEAFFATLEGLLP